MNSRVASLVAVAFVSTLSHVCAQETLEPPELQQQLENTRAVITETSQRVAREWNLSRARDVLAQLEGVYLWIHQTHQALNDAEQAIIRARSISNPTPNESLEAIWAARVAAWTATKALTDAPRVVADESRLRSVWDQRCDRAHIEGLAPRIIDPARFFSSQTDVWTSGPSGTRFGCALYLGPPSAGSQPTQDPCYLQSSITNWVFMSLPPGINLLAPLGSVVYSGFRFDSLANDRARNIQRYHALYEAHLNAIHRRAAEFVQGSCTQDLQTAAFATIPQCQGRPLAAWIQEVEAHAVQLRVFAERALADGSIAARTYQAEVLQSLQQSTLALEAQWPASTTLEPAAEAFFQAQIAPLSHAIRAPNLRARDRLAVADAVWTLLIQENTRIRSPGLGGVQGMRLRVNGVHRQWERRVDETTGGLRAYY